MTPRKAGRLVTAALVGGMLFSGCTTLVKIPGGNVDVSDDGVFVDFLGLSISVTDDHVLVNLPGIDVEVNPH